jgi:hypothetical protein
MRNATLAFFLVLIPCSLHAQDKKSDWRYTVFGPVKRSNSLRLA